MLIKHNDKTPSFDPSTYIAPNAMLCGNVKIGKNCRIMFGAQIIAENSPIIIGDNCIILENAVIRGCNDFPVTIGNNCLVGPHAHLAGCTIEDEVFVATGASVFHGAVLKKGSEVRINGIVHLMSTLPENATVPIGWIAVGDPIKIISPDKDDEIWPIQKPLNFPKTVYGIDRPQTGETNNMPAICKSMSDRLGSFLQDDVKE